MLKIRNQVELWPEIPFKLKADAKYLVEEGNREQKNMKEYSLQSEASLNVDNSHPEGRVLKQPGHTCVVV